MADVAIYLENALAALRNEVRPAVQDEAALSAIVAIEQILARLMINADAAPAAEGIATLSTLAGHYGGAGALSDATAQAKRGFADGGTAGVHDLLAWEADIVGGVHDRAMAVIDAQHQPDRAAEGAKAQAVDVAALEQWLRGRTGSAAGRIERFSEVLGGRSKITAMLSLSGFDGLPDRMVMRRDAGMNMTGGTSVVAEFPLLQALHAHGVLVPQPYFVESDPAVAGSPFILMGRVAGQAGRIYHSPGSVSLMRDVAATLARLHRVPVAEAGLVSTPLTREGLLAEIQDVETRWHGFGGPASVATTIAFDWLRANLDRALQGEQSVVHGDVLFHNIMFDGDRMTALLDWELARISYPAADLGYVLPAVTRVMPWEDFMTAYRAAGGPDVPQDAVDFFSIWSNLYMSMLSANVIDLIRKRTISDVQMTAVCLHDIAVWTNDLVRHLLRTTSYS